MWCVNWGGEGHGEIRRDFAPLVSISKEKLIDPYSRFALEVLRKEGSRRGSELPAPGGEASYLTQRFFRVVLQKSVLTQIWHLVLYISNSKGQVDELVGELTSAKRLEKHFV